VRIGIGSGAARRTEVDLRDVMSGLAQLRARGKDPREVMREAKGMLQTDIAEHFDRNEGPDGPWQGRAAATIARARGRRTSYKATAKTADSPGGVTKRSKRGFRVFKTNTKAAPNRKGTFRTKRGQSWMAQQLGRFRDVNTYRFTLTRTSIEMRARGPWAGVHQFGGTAGRGAKIPQRTFLWASDRLVEHFASSLQNHLRGGWDTGASSPAGFFSRLGGSR